MLDILDQIAANVAARNAELALRTGQLSAAEAYGAELAEGLDTANAEIARLQAIIDAVPPPPEGTDEDGGPLFTPPPGFENGTTGNYWNLGLTGDITERLQNMLDADQPVFLGRSEGRTVTCKGVVVKKNYQIRGSGMAKCVIRMTEPKPFIETPADWPLSGVYAGDFKIYGKGDAPIFLHAGFSNGSTHERIDYRSGGYAIDLIPSPADKSAAFKGTIVAPFAFSQTKGFLRVRAGNGASTTLCHLTIINADIGRCGGPVLQFERLRADQSAILLWHCLMDMQQGTINAPHGVQFTDCDNSTLTWISGKVTGADGKDIIVADSDVQVRLQNVIMWGNPVAPAFARNAIVTPTLTVPVPRPGGVVSWPATGV